MNKILLPALALGFNLAVSGVALAHSERDCKGAGPRAAHFERLDADRSGLVTLDELSRSKEQWFARFDANKDNVLTRDELRMRNARRDQRGDRIFERRDANKDGKLTADEAKGPPQLFQRADKNQDRVVTKPELSTALAARDQRAKGERFFGKLDRNGDGKLSRDEAIADAARVLERFDADGDRALSREELARRGGKPHARRPKAGDQSAPAKPPASEPSRNGSTRS